MEGTKHRNNFLFHYRDVPVWLKAKPNAFHLFAEFARRARWSEGDAILNAEAVRLKKGEFLTGRTNTSRELGLTEAEYRTAFSLLERQNMIKTIRTTSRYTIGLLCDSNIFDPFATTESPTKQPTIQPPEEPSSEPFFNHVTTTNNTNNTENNVNYRLSIDEENIERYEKMKKEYFTEDFF